MLNATASQPRFSGQVQGYMMYDKDGRNNGTYANPSDELVESVGRVASAELAQRLNMSVWHIKDGFFLTHDPDKDKVNDQQRFMDIWEALVQAIKPSVETVDQFLQEATKKEKAQYDKALDKAIAAFKTEADVVSRPFHFYVTTLQGRTQSLDVEGAGAYFVDILSDEQFLRTQPYHRGAISPAWTLTKTQAEDGSEIEVPVFVHEQVTPAG